MIHSKELERKHLVLIVDDQEINRDVLGAILEDDYDVIFAENGEQALEMIREYSNRLSIVLLDLMMPVMDGMTVLKVMREDDMMSNIPVIVLTSEKSAELEALQAGALDFITKPFDMHEIIIARVRRIIELSDGRQLIQAAERDSVSGLYNRSFFFEYADRIYHDHPDWHMDAVIINIERFHSVNDLNGREFGDKVLRLIGDTIRDFLSGTKGIAARLEADRFDIYCLHRDEYASVLEKLQRAVNTLSDRVSIRLRMGVKPWRENVPPTLMFDRARVACNMVRGSYKSHLMVFDEDMRERELFQQRLLNDLRRAVEERQLIVYYQPKYNIKCDTPRLSSAEALIRWKHPELGMISPGQFIPLFESNGLIHIIDSYVWEEAARQIAAWRDKLGMTLPVSVNLSRTDIFDPMLEKNLLDLVERNGLSTEYLKLEVTESAYTDNAQQLIEVIQNLRTKGFQIEMDDFGSGYSSLNMLSSLPIDVLKMDMQFMRNLKDDEKDFRLIELIIDIAGYLKVPVIAEGAETADQVEFLKSVGCDLVQGYYFSKPVPASEFETYIQKEIDLKWEGVVTLSIQQLYELIGGNYEHALQIMKKDKMINKYLLKLSGSGLYEELMAASEEMDPTRMFEAAHAMKGVCANLGLDKLSELVGKITEEFRPGSARSLSGEELKALLDETSALYAKTVEGIKQYEESLNIAN